MKLIVSMDSAPIPVSQLAIIARLFKAGGVVSIDDKKYTVESADLGQLADKTWQFEISLEERDA
jgi:hypothetical protein